MHPALAQAALMRVKKKYIYLYGSVYISFTITYINYCQRLMHNIYNCKTIG